MAQPSGQETTPSGKLFKSGNGLALILPKPVVERYHLAPGVRVEIHQTDEGIVLLPVDVQPWFSIEWERAMNAVLARYTEALAPFNSERTNG